MNISQGSPQSSKQEQRIASDLRMETNSELGDDLKNPRRRRVHFANDEEIIRIQHLNELTDEEIDRVWETRERLNRIQLQCRLLVYKNDNESDSYIQGDTVNGHPLRGLIKHSLVYTNKKEVLQKLIFVTVGTIQENQNQQEERRNVVDLLARLCSKFSSISVQAALDIAEYDYQAAYEEDCGDS